jgi:hypothetical protein
MRDGCPDPRRANGTCLEFVAIIGTNFSDPEGKALDHVVNEGDGVGLGVPTINLEGRVASSMAVYW